MSRDDETGRRKPNALASQRKMPADDTRVLDGRRGLSHGPSRIAQDLQITRQNNIAARRHTLDTSRTPISTIPYGVMDKTIAWRQMSLTTPRKHCNLLKI
ncbi:hypothetical protein NLA06_04955 [Desulfomicrobium sp. ZS1]|uniref:hypothetical protein n=1 Tax=Desulfomicrobium sp. ZS1 TaxID=2952228 RepID=UPI0020B1C2DF|nr:hypothetical protein [Desulfomicrobium sp. ZS1]UTF51243.1 hypothetical protein NLA06_04955 [Desulfomicrobium sp. ZS1]